MDGWVFLFLPIKRYVDGNEFHAFYKYTIFIKCIKLIFKYLPKYFLLLADFKYIYSLPL
jgi:hypothetical protein